MREVLDIKRSSYYAWLNRPPTERQNNDIKLTVKIKRLNKDSYCTYGARLIKAKLNSEGINCGKNKISRLMKENNISSKITRKFKATTYSNHNFNVAPNLLKQNFDINATKTGYVEDIKYIGTDEVWVVLGYCCRFI